MAHELACQMHKMHQGDHICLIYQNLDEQMAAVVPFIKAGLSRNECCVYIVDDREIHQIQKYFSEAGVCLDSEARIGRLIFATKRDAYLKFGSFDPDGMINYLEELAQEALDRGFTAFRVTGEMTWALGQEIGCDRLIEYEAKLNHYFPGSKASAICQYNKTRFTPEVIRDVLRTHPIAVVGDQVCTNLYFETPEMVLGEESAENRVDWMISQLKSFKGIETSYQKAISSRDDFLSIASHELRTPLTSIKLQNDMYRDEVGAGECLDSETVKEMLEVNHRQINQLNRLVEDMLDISRITHGQLTMDKRKIRLDQIVKNTCDQFAQESSNLIRLETDPQSSYEIEVDPIRIQQVFSNLLSNALKYGEQKPVTVSLKSDDQFVQLKVKDEGIGISEADQRRIFERFERAVNSRKASGLGLGLYISREIIEAHDGKIGLVSQLDRGSTFTVKIPRYSSTYEMKPQDRAESQQFAET